MKYIAFIIVLFSAGCAAKTYDQLRLTEYEVKK